MSNHSRACPRDEGDVLGAIDTGEGPSVDFCRSCGGTFFEPGELQEFMGLPLATDLVAEGRHTGAGPACPGCQQAMVALEWPPDSGLVIDVCPKGGVWLDGGETAKLRRAVAGKARWGQHTQGGEVFDVPLRPLDGALGRRDWRWLGLSALLILLSQVAAMGLLLGLRSLELAADQEVVPELALVGLASLVGFGVGGFITGRVSEGFTVWEPALASVPAVIVFVLLFQASFSVPVLGAVMVLGVLLSLLGAVVGERMQGH